MTKQHGRETFVVQILNQQNTTWQGLITWTERQKTQPFRSTLELIKLMDSALSEESEEENQVGWDKKGKS